MRAALIGLTLLGLACASGGKIPADECGRVCGSAERVEFLELQCERIDGDQEDVDTCKLGIAIAWQLCLSSCEREQ